VYEALLVTPWPWWVAGPAIGTVAGILVGTYVFGRLRSFGDRPGLASEPHPA
jgi:hypothetical protein